MQTSRAVQHVVAVLLFDPNRGQQLAERLTHDNVHAINVSNSDELHGLVNRERVDVIVVENELHGFLNGVEIIKRLYDGLTRPATLLLAHSVADLRAMSEKLQINCVLPADATVDEIATNVDRLLERSLDIHVFIPAEARRVVQQFKGMRPLPQLLPKLLPYLSLPANEIPIDELAEHISVDPKATAQLLKMTNSASMGFRRSVTSISDAVTLLGPKQAIRLIFSSSAIISQAEFLQHWSEAFRKWYHQRSVLIACTARAFSQTMESLPGETAFILGLLQEVGVLVMANKFEQSYIRSLERVRAIAHLQLIRMEQDTYGVTHAAVGAALLQQWDMPQALIRPVFDHHGPLGEGERETFEERMLRAMQIGEAVADLSDVCHPRRLRVLNQLLEEYGCDRARECQSCLADGVAKAMKASELFSLPVPDSKTLHNVLKEISSWQAA